MNNLFHISAVALTVLFTSNAAAHNTYAMPGDGGIMTAIDLEKIPAVKNKTLKLHYAFSSKKPLMMCGYLGYGQIQIDNLSNDQWQALLGVIKRCEAIREECYPKKRRVLEDKEKQISEAAVDIQGNKIDLTEEAADSIKKIRFSLRDLDSTRLYIQLFDHETLFCYQGHEEKIYQDIRPGLRYNETIFSREKEHRHHATYGFHLSDKALGYEWRKSHQLKPIKLTNKEPMIGAFMGEEEPAKIDGSGVCFAVLVGPDPLPYAEATNTLGYYVVRPDGSIEAYALGGAELPKEDLEKYPMRLPEEDE